MRYVAVALAGLLAGCMTSTVAQRGVGTRSAVSPPPPPSPPGFTWRAEPAVIQFELGDASLPTVAHGPRVRAGTPLEVRLFSYGGGCEAPGGADVTMDGNEARIAVWDYTRIPLQGDPRQMVCTTALSTFKRTVWLVFPEPGSASIVISGKRHDGTTGRDVPATVLGSVAVE